MFCCRSLWRNQGRAADGGPIPCCSPWRNQRRNHCCLLLLSPWFPPRGICCHCFPLFQRLLSFNVVAPCMAAADLALLADSMIAVGALQTLSQTPCSIQRKLLP